jgi:LysM repeat protein
MRPSNLQVDELKFILDNIRTPSHLDDHPWTKSLAVQEQVLKDPSLGEKSPGYKLIVVLSRLFQKMMPSAPPRRGKRLDTRWCQFGMLAAQYFAPFLFGSIFPVSLRDAWGRIDQAIPYFVFGKPGYDLPASEVARYCLFGDDAEPAPVSTLSDWHIMGLQRLVDLFLENERHLSQKLSQTSPVLQSSGMEIHSAQDKEIAPASAFSDHAGSLKIHKSRSKLKKILIGGTASILLVGMILLSAKAWRIYREVRMFQGDLDQIIGLISTTPDIASFGQAEPLLSNSRQHLALLKSDVGPILWAGKYLAWVPRYGGDLTQAGTLLDFASGLLATADETARGIAPLWQKVQVQDQQPKLSEIVELLVAAQPCLSAANAALNDASAARSKLDTGRLSAGIRSIITNKVDPNLPLLQDGLALATAFPRLAGASTSGPQTYLLLMQNEDELRATGGFLTDVGTLVIKDGEIISYDFENSYDLDDLSKSYPPAPWQLERYMDAHMLLLRDSNWSPDFPTSAALAEYLFAYKSFHTSDGMIAIDQHAVQMLLKIIGPVTIDTVSYPITSENVIEYMRTAKFDSGNGPYDPTQRKDFIGELGGAILMKLKSAQNISLEALSKTLIDTLNQKHILLQLDDPVMTTVLSERGWDGAVRPGKGDYLMVVDSNIGFTKSNAVVDSQVDYWVDLSNLANPVAELKLIYTNHASGNVPCTSIGVRLPSDAEGTLSYQQQIDRCYWDYLRVYSPSGTQLLAVIPHAVQGEWMLDGQGVPARVDILDEGIVGVQSFGTLFVVPIGKTLETSFRFLLPSGIVQGDGRNKRVYQLHVQKQPGTQANPVNICVKLPAGSSLLNSSPAGELKTGMWCLDKALLTDLNLTLAFSIPSSYVSTSVTYATVTSAPTEARRIVTLTPAITSTVAAIHALETPFGVDYQFVIHRVKKGESLALLSSRYGTTEDAIKAVNYQLPNPLTVNFMIVIPVDIVDVQGLPSFEVYKVSKSISLGDLAKQLQIDQKVLAYYNGMAEARVLKAGEWILIPHLTGTTP